MSNHESIYTYQAEIYDRLISAQPGLAETVRGIRPFRDLDVVDLGAGTGRLSAFLAPEAKSLVATDRSAAMLELLGKKLACAGLSNWTTRVADHRLLPLPDASADLVVSGWSVCYLADAGRSEWKENLSRVMSEIHRILRHDGTVILFETLGTGCLEPDPPDFLVPYYRALEEEYGFSHTWIRTDYTFKNPREAEDLVRFFFGDRLAGKAAARQWATVPECAGVWWKHNA